VPVSVMRTSPWRVRRRLWRIVCLPPREDLSLDPTDLLRLLVDPERLAVAGALAAGPGTTSELAGRAGVDERTVLEVVARLVRGGLAVGDAEDGYALEPSAWQALARSVATVVQEPDPTIGFGMTADERAVLGRFFEGRTLRQLPSSRSSRLVVLERLALEFEPGRHYHELEVNELLGQFLQARTETDWSSLRRHLVDEGLLDRDNANMYWRSGGRVV